MTEKQKITRDRKELSQVLKMTVAHLDFSKQQIAVVYGKTDHKAGMIDAFKEILERWIERLT